MVGRQVLATTIVAVALASLSWAQSNGTVPKDRGKYVPPPPKPVSTEPELKTGRPFEDPDAPKTPPQNPTTPGPPSQTVRPSSTPTPLQSGLLSPPSSSDIDASKLRPLELARQIQERQNLLNRMGSVEAARYSIELEEAIESHPAQALPELLGNLLGSTAGSFETREAYGDAGRNLGQVRSGNRPAGNLVDRLPITDEPVERTDALRSLDIEKRAIVYDAKKLGYQAPPSIREASPTIRRPDDPTNIKDPPNDLRDKLRADVSKLQKELDAASPIQKPTSSGNRSTQLDYIDPRAGASMLERASTVTGSRERESIFDWSQRTFPDIHGPASNSISFGDMTTKRSPEGFTATPTVKGNLDPYAVNRSFSKTYVVSSSNGSPIADGFTDVKFLGGDRFLARTSALGNDGYKIYDAKTGRPISAQEFRYAEPLGDGYFSVPTTTAGIGMSDIVAPDGNIAIRGAYSSYAPAAVANGTLSYSVGGKTQTVALHPTGVPQVSAVPPVANPGGILLGKDQKYQAQPGLAAETEQLLREIDGTKASTSGGRMQPKQPETVAIDCSSREAVVRTAERNFIQNRTLLSSNQSNAKVNIKALEYLVAVNAEVLDRARVSLVACLSGQ
jgi:hypothetical protein